MMVNPLKARAAETGSAVVVAPSDQTERQRFWIDRGNRILWGQEETKKYGYLQPRHDLEWACINGSYFIQSRRMTTTPTGAC